MSRAARRLRTARRTATATDRGLPMPLKRERVLRAIADLPEDQRLLLSLCIVEGLTADETAELTGLSSRAVRSACDRMLMMLRRALNGAGRRRGPVVRRPQDAAVRRAV